MKDKTKKRKVLYSPGFGAGWTTWNKALIPGKERECVQLMLEWAPLIEAVERGDTLTTSHPAFRSLLATLRLLGMESDEELYAGGLDQLEVGVGDGDVKVNEYDGSESLTWRSGIDDGWL